MSLAKIKQSEHAIAAILISFNLELTCFFNMHVLTPLSALTGSHAVETMMARGAVSDQQQEEHAIYREAASGMDVTLMQKKGSDAVVKMLHRNKNAHIGQFLSGAAKRSLAEQRRADEAVQQQYYGYQFK